MHNATYDLGWLRAEGVNVQGRIIDTMITGAVVDENRYSYSLNNLGRDYLEERKNEKLLRAAAAEWGIDPKAEMWKLPPKYVGLYAEQDAAMTLRLWERLKVEIEKLDLWSIWKLETSLIPMMMDMRKMGVRVDLDGADRARKMLRQRKKDIHDIHQGQERRVGRTVGRGLRAEGLRGAEPAVPQDRCWRSVVHQAVSLRASPMRSVRRSCSCARRTRRTARSSTRSAARAQRAHPHRISPASQR
jgi:hypothetical protein